MSTLDNLSDIPADLLKGVSRSFYLTIRVLPGPLRVPIQLAYLLARAADTIADTPALPPETRLEHLKRLRTRLDCESNNTAPVDIDLAPEQPAGDSPEDRLLQNVHHLFTLLEGLHETDRRSVEKTVDTLIRGMEFDLATFPTPESGRIGALDSMDDLENYTYLVAGCVGEFWTDVVIAHDPAAREWDRERMAELGVRFGKALQMTNIVRDVPKDLRVGRCYVPREMLESAHLSPEDLLSPSTSQRARPVLAALVGRALDFYVSAEEYILATPRRSARLRLAMIWPVLIGLATLELLMRSPNWLDPENRIRVSRPWIYGMMIRSIPCAWSNTLFKSWTRRLHSRFQATL